MGHFDLRIYVTNRCNSRCQYCYRGLGGNDPTVDRHTDIPVDSIFRLLDIRPGAIQSVKLSGGEPAFHPGLTKIIGGLSHRKVFMELYSNGALTRLSDKTLDQVGKFNLSLDSVDSQINCMTRGDRHATKSFLQAINRLKELDKNEIEVQITLSKASLPQLSETIAYLVEELGVERLKVSDIVEKEEGAYSHLRLCQNGLGEALRVIEESRERYHYTKIINTTFFDRIEYVRMHRNIRHLFSAFLNQSSDFYFFIGEESLFHIGNISREDPDRIWVQFMRIAQKADRMIEHAFEEIRLSDKRYITPTEFLYDNEILARFKDIP